ncbi:MAG TPA: inorganic diphosphatase [Pyrinomonadaceae bacterium]|jgi:inorganic pyrophosphatase
MTGKAAPHARTARLTAFDAEGEDVNVIVETPKGSRNKFNYDDELGLFKLGGVLPAGAVFPFDFGFVPATLGGDGDPLDVLLLMDEPAFPGCLVMTRLIGVIEAEQTEGDGEPVRNDRLIGVAAKARNYKGVRALSQLNENLVAEIEHFFVSYNEMKGKVFKPTGRGGAARARALVEEGARAFARRHKRPRAAAKKRARKR